MTHIIPGSAEWRLAEIKRLRLVEVCWLDFKRMLVEVGAPKSYPGGSIRWVQDQIQEVRP